MERIGQLPIASECYFSSPQSTFNAWVTNGQGAPGVTLALLGQFWFDRSRSEQGTPKATSREDSEPRAPWGCRERLTTSHVAEATLQYSLKKVHLTETTRKNDLRVVWAPIQSRENPTERGKNVFQKRDSGSSKGEKMNIFTNHRAFSSGWFIKWVVLFLLSLQATTELFNELQLTMLFLKHLGHLWGRKTEGEGK